MTSLIVLATNEIFSCIHCDQSTFGSWGRGVGSANAGHFNKLSVPFLLDYTFSTSYSCSFDLPP